MIQFNFHKKIGIKPSFRFTKDKYGPWLYVYSFRCWWSLFSFSLDQRTKAREILERSDITFLDKLFKKDSATTRVWMKKNKMTIKSNID